MFEPIFPGIDPYLESQRWSEFHNLMISQMRLELGRLLIPRYDVSSETYVNLHLRPDVSILQGKPETEPLQLSTAAIATADRLITPTITEVDDQRRIEIRDWDGKLVTVIELLSPANKTRHRDRYLANRDAILLSDVHLIEIDWLRGGQRMEPSTEQVVGLILVARARSEQSHQGELYEMSLRGSIPIVPVPLTEEDEDVPLNLPDLYREVYIKARYRLQLDYEQPLTPPLKPEDQDWAKQLLSSA